MRNLAKLARDLATNMRDGAAALEEAAMILEQSSVVRVAERLGVLAGSAPLASPEPVRPVLVATGVAATNDLQPFYQNLGMLLADARRINFQYAIAIDEKAAWPGFGPANKYRTNADGSLSAA